MRIKTIKLLDSAIKPRNDITWDHEIKDTVDLIIIVYILSVKVLD